MAELEETIIESSAGRAIVQERSVLTGINSTDMEILSKLEEKNRFMEQRKVAYNDPTFLLSLDQINISNPNAFSASLKKIIDVPNGGKNRVAYLYPMLVSSAGKPLFKLFLMMPPKAGNARDATGMREKCFEKSIPLIKNLLEAKQSRNTEIDEENPGGQLLRNDGKVIKFIPEFLSLEYDFKRILKKSFDKVELAYIEISDFFRDLKLFFSQNRNMVEEILPDYHIVIDTLQLTEDGDYAKNPEIIRHYRAIADAVEKYALPLMLDAGKKKDFGHFLSDYNAYQSTHVANAPPGRKQNNDRVTALINLLKEFPHEKMAEKEWPAVKENIAKGLQILEILKEKKDALVSRKQGQLSENIYKKLFSMIQGYTRQNLDLLLIDLRKEIRSVIKDTTMADDIERDFEGRLMNDFAGQLISVSDNSKLYYFVDHRIFSSVLENLSRLSRTESGAKERFAIASKLFEQLLLGRNTHLDSQLTGDERARLAQQRVANLNSANASSADQKRSERMNPAQGVLVSLVCAIIYAAALFYSTQLIWLAFPLLLVSVISFYRIGQGSKKEKDILHEEVISAPGNFEAGDLSMENDNEKEAKMKAQVIHEAETLMFPTRTSSFEEKVITEEQYRDRAKEVAASLTKKMPEAQTLAQKKNLAKIVYDGVRNDCVCIMTPSDMLKKSMGKLPPAIYIGYRDFSSDTTRNKIAEGYRNNFKPNLAEWDQEYHRYIINTLELKYYTYLKKNIRK